MSSSISGPIGHTVDLGGSAPGAYSSPLSINSTGSVAPSSGDVAVYSDTAGVSLENSGTVTGGAGATGVDFTQSGTVTNNLQINGGIGPSGGGSGGAAISLHGGRSLNNGYVEGGNGYGAGHVGGDGVDIVGGTITNGATQFAKAEGSYGHLLGGNGETGADGGIGVNAVNAQVINNASVLNGGTAYGNTGTGGIGVQLSGAASLSNYALLHGGAGYGSSSSTSGGVAVNAETGTSIFNHYDIFGGEALGRTSTSADGAAGVVLGQNAQLTNYAGANVGGGFSLDGTPGVGVDLSATGANVVNHGDIYGGQSSSAMTGGTGVVLASGTTLNNSGEINGGMGSGTNGHGGIGAILEGGTLTTSGTIEGNFAALGGPALNDSVLFGSGDSKLVVDSNATFSGDFGGFAAGDKIDMDNMAPGSYTFLSATDTLSTPHNGTLQFDGDLGQTFLFDPINHGTGTEITIACYRRGTRIRTAEGDVPIENLGLGDRVLTLAGERPIRWIGRRSYSGQFAAGNSDVLPVRILAGALDVGIPARDLWVSPEHALWLDDALIPARALVNGRSIVQASGVDEVSYLHLEFDAHEIIYAEGAPAESFIDDESRDQFDNAAQFRALYPDAAPKAAQFCAPRVEDGALLERVRQRLLARNDASVASSAVTSELAGQVDLVRRDCVEGWAQSVGQSDAPVLLRVLDNGLTLGEVLADRYRPDLAAAGIGDGCHAFAFSIPGGLSPDARHRIEVQRVLDGRALHGSPAELSARPAVALNLSSEPPIWQGALDVLTRERIEGWAWDERSPEAPLSLAILDNGEVIARVLANRYRRDLEQADVGDGRHAFSVQIPGGLSPLTQHVIQVVNDADGCQIRRSPFFLAPAGEFDGALEQAVSLAIASLDTAQGQDRALTFLAEQTHVLLQQHAEAISGRESRLIQRQLERRWGSAQGPTASESASRRRALFIDDRLPTPSQDAGSNAILSHMRALRDSGYEVSLAAADELSPSPAARAALEAQGIECCRTPYYASVEEVLRRRQDCFDVVYLHRASNASRYLALARQYAPHARILYSVADLHHLRLARQAAVEARTDLLAQSRRLRLIECTAAASADAVITHSSVEASWLRGTIKGCNVHVVPWSVPVRPVSAAWHEREGVAFIGNFAHAPNVDAARFLCTQIMSRVWQQAPSIRCLMVGSHADKAIQMLASERVSVLGEVSNLADIFRRVRMTVAPLRYGAGVKGKVLESLAAGVPCVMTPIAAEGIALPSALSRTIATDAAQLATHIVRLHDEAAESAALAAAGSRWIEETCRDELVVAGLNAAIEGRRAPEQESAPAVRSIA